MANPVPYDIFPVPPEATYNSPDITYNEKCLSYNGEWDLVCLYGAVGRRKGGRSGARSGTLYKSKPRHFPDQETIDLLFNIHITTEYDDEDLDITKRYRIPKSEGLINIAAEKIHEIIEKETIPFVTIDHLVQKDEPQEEPPEADVSGSLETAEIKETPEPIVEELGSGRLLHSIYDTVSTNIFGKIKKAISRDVDAPRISGTFEKTSSPADKAVSVKGSIGEHKTYKKPGEEPIVSGLLESSASYAPEEPSIFSKISKAVFRKTEDPLKVFGTITEDKQDPEPVVEGKSGGKLLHSLYDAIGTDISGKIKKTVSREVNVPKISGSFEKATSFEKPISVEGSINEQETHKKSKEKELNISSKISKAVFREATDSNVTSKIKSTAAHVPSVVAGSFEKHIIREKEEPIVSSKIEKAVVHEAEEPVVSGAIIEETIVHVPEDTVISNIIEEEHKEEEQEVVPTVSSTLNEQIIVNTVSVDAASGSIGLKETKVTSILEGNLSPQISSSLVFNIMTKFPTKE